MVDETFVDRYQRGVGARFVLRRLESTFQEVEIVGVTARQAQLQEQFRQTPRVWVPLEASSPAVMLVRYGGPPADVEAAVRGAVRKLDGDVTVTATRIEDHFQMFLSPARMISRVAGALGLMALILACTGVAGVVGFTVNRRMREVGIRMALGADRREILALFVRQGLVPVAVGVVFGLAMATGGSKLMSGLLYGVSPWDPVAFGMGALAMMAAGVVAVVAPVRRALRADPALVLREE
jgi:predicted lysophospholipase L1 biosynthesis ABC-type transport system permease subunit